MPAATIIKSHSQNQQGSAVILVLAILLLMLYLGALVVDITALQKMGDSIECAADAAALAGANQLVLQNDLTNVDRWKNSKRAILGMLQAHLLQLAILPPVLLDPTSHKGPKDACEGIGRYNSQTYENDSVRIELERGVYVDSEPPEFTSLEDALTCNANASPKPNAVRVRLTAGRKPLMFAFMAGFGKKSTLITRQAIAARID